MDAANSHEIRTNGQAPAAPPAGLPHDDQPAGLPGLSPQHVADLRRSRLADGTIRDCGFRSVGATEAARILGWVRPPRGMGEFLAIPYFAPDGSPLEYTRLKPDRPRKDKAKKKSIKYEAPKGKPNRAYFPPATRAILADPAVPLLLTEGEKKSAKADQEGFYCIGIPGVWSWQKSRNADDPNAARVLIADLAAVAWQGRPVFIVFDSDAAEKREVAYAEWYLAEALTAAGAAVRVVRLPPGPDGAKCGVDDYLIGRGPDALRQLLDAAQAPARPPGAARAADKDAPTVEADDDPHRLARIYRAASRVQEQHDGKAVWTEALHYHRGEFLRYEGGSYQPVPSEDIRAELTASVKQEFERLGRKAAQARSEQDGDEEADAELTLVKRVTRSLVGDVLQALTGEAHVAAAREPPVWLKDPPAWPATEGIAGPKEILHVPSLIEGKPCLIPATPRLLTRTAIDYAVDLHAPAPTGWLTFLDQLWRDDPQAVAALQEAFGLALMSETKYKNIFMIVGPKRSGKGTLFRVLRRMVGAANVCSPTLASLSQNFGLWPLVGKSLALISDARLSGRADAAVVVERLLSISGEDDLTIDRKYLSPITIKLGTRIFIATNELPRLNDASGALVSRLVVLRLTKSFYGREDIGLTDRLLTELPAVLLWSIAGWERLRRRGHFVQPGSSRELLQTMDDLSSPVNQFLREWCEVGPKREVAVKRLFAEWKRWCEAAGRPHSSEQTFGRDLRAALPDLDDRQPRAEDGGRVRVYVGVALKPQEDQL